MVEQKQIFYGPVRMLEMKENLIIHHRNIKEINSCEGQRENNALSCVQDVSGRNNTIQCCIYHKTHRAYLKFLHTPPRRFHTLTVEICYTL